MTSDLTREYNAGDATLFSNQGYIWRTRSLDETNAPIRGAGDTRKDSQAEKVIRDMIRLVLGQKNYSFIQLHKIQDSL